MKIQTPKNVKILRSNLTIDEVIRIHALQYPTLYGDLVGDPSRYEITRMKVLDHLFCTLGNGEEWENGILGGSAFLSEQEVEILNNLRYQRGGFRVSECPGW